MTTTVKSEDVKRLLGYSKKDLAYNLVEVGTKLNENEKILVQFAAFYRECTKLYGEEKVREIEKQAIEALNKEIEERNSDKPQPQTEVVEQSVTSEIVQETTSEPV